MPAQLPDSHAVDTTAEVAGDLLQWLRAASGEWLGLVTYQLPFADQRHQRIYLERQLLPAYSLRPRKYGRHRQKRGLWERHAGRRCHLSARPRADKTWTFRPGRRSPRLNSGLNIQRPMLVCVDGDRRLPGTCPISESQVRDIPVLSGTPGCSRAGQIRSPTERRTYGGRRGRRTFDRPTVDGLCEAANSLPSSASPCHPDDLGRRTRSWQDNPANCQPGRGRGGPAVDLHECADRGGERHYGADHGDHDGHT
jgi:hypothetical protein